MKSYHFIGIGGIGMGTLASLLLDKGCRVSGSDLKASLMTEELQKKGAVIMIGHRIENVGEPDCVVYSSAVSAENDEIKAAKEKGILVIKRAQVLAQLMAEKKGIAIAGAHGKTTTSSMVAHLLKKGNFHPTIAVGGIINEGLYSADTGTGDYFVAEVDESDGTFLYFSPDYAIITNIDFEHIDYYQNWENIMNAYGQFMQKLSPEGLLIINGDDERLLQLAKDSGRKTLRFGLGERNDIFVDSIKMEGFQTSFKCISKEKEFGQIQLAVPGQHNVRNALAAICLAKELGMDFSDIQKAFLSFKGVQRRFTLRGCVNDILIIDDYGHHPTEISATLAAARQWSGRRVVTVFQPHRYTRTQHLMDELAQSLVNCDHLVLTDIYAASEAPQENVTSQVLINKIKVIKKEGVVYLAMDGILDHLAEICKKGDLVLFLGAGNINHLIDPFIDILGKKE